MTVQLLRPYAEYALGDICTFSTGTETALVNQGIAKLITSAVSPLKNTEPFQAMEYPQTGTPMIEVTTTPFTIPAQPCFVIGMNSASAQVFDIGPTPNWPLGTVCTVIQKGAGAFTLTPAAGVTISTTASSLISAGQFSITQLIKYDSTTWIATGGGLGG
jgi:hypothetical protein